MVYKVTANIIPIELNKFGKPTNGKFSFPNLNPQVDDKIRENTPILISAIKEALATGLNSVNGVDFSIIEEQIKNELEKNGVLGFPGLRALNEKGKLPDDNTITLDTYINKLITNNKIKKILNMKMTEVKAIFEQAGSSIITKNDIVAYLNMSLINNNLSAMDELTIRSHFIPVDDFGLSSSFETYSKQYISLKLKEAKSMEQTYSIAA